MSDHDWQVMGHAHAQEAIKEHGMKPLPLSCDRYKYFGTAAYPVIKHDSRKGVFYSNEFYLDYLKNNLDK